MRALVLAGGSVTVSERHPEPKPADGEVVLTLRAGLLGTTEVALAQDAGSFEGVLGQSFVAVRADGTRVTGSPIVHCGTCPMCASGLRQHCRTRVIAGQSGRDGVLAERFALPESNLVPVPDTLDDEAAVFAPIAATALQASMRLAIEGKPYVTVLGDGPLGLLTAQVLARRNASVRVIGRHAARLALCERWGIKHRPLEDVGRRRDQDVVVECSDAPDGLAVALTLVRPRGTIIAMSVTAPTAPLDLAPIVLDELTVLGASGGPLGSAVHAMARGEIDATGLSAGRVSLAEADVALARLVESGGLPVLVRA